MLKQVQEFFADFSANTPAPILVALKIILVIVAYLILLKVGRRCIRSLMDKLNASRNVPIPARKINTVKTLTTSIYKILLLFICIATVIHLVGLDAAFTSLLATAGGGGLAIGFGAQSLIKDCISGFFLLLEDQITVGDFVKLNGVEGTVESVQLRVTTIRSYTGELTIIPNGSITQVTNLSRGPSLAVVDMSIAYEADIPRATKALLAEAEAWAVENQEIVVEPPSVAGVVGLADSAVVLRVVCRVQSLKHWGAQNQLRSRLKQRLDREGIEIPYPHQTVIVRRDAPGGEGGSL